MRWDKNLVGGGYCRRVFSIGGMKKILAYGGTLLVGETLIFRLLLYKQTRVFINALMWLILGG